MNAGSEQVKGKGHQIQLWISPIFGIIFTLAGLVTIILAFNQSDHDSYITLLLIGLYCFIIGIPYIILGILNIYHTRGDKKRRIRGWLLAIVGSLSSIIGLFSIISQIDLAINGAWAIYLSSSLPPLIIGLWIFIIGVREINRKENISTVV
jgi:uncharacterized membrane protein HdeD (DUF308 family)